MWLLGVLQEFTKWLLVCSGGCYEVVKWLSGCSGRLLCEFYNDLVGCCGSNVVYNGVPRGFYVVAVIARGLLCGCLGVLRGYYNVARKLLW